MAEIIEWVKTCGEKIKNGYWTIENIWLGRPDVDLAMLFSSNDERTWSVFKLEKHWEFSQILSTFFWNIARKNTSSPLVVVLESRSAFEVKSALGLQKVRLNQISYISYMVKNKYYLIQRIVFFKGKNYWIQFNSFRYDMNTSQSQMQKILYNVRYRNTFVTSIITDLWISFQGWLCNKL